MSACPSARSEAARPFTANSGHVTLGNARPQQVESDLSVQKETKYCGYSAEAHVSASSTSPNRVMMTASLNSPIAGSPVRENAMAPQLFGLLAIVAAIVRPRRNPGILGVRTGAQNRPHRCNSAPESNPAMTNRSNALRRRYQFGSRADLQLVDPHRSRVRRQNSCQLRSVPPVAAALTADI